METEEVFGLIMQLLQSRKMIKKAILVFLIVLAAYWQTLRMYVWQDDHAVMFKLQNVAQTAGHFGRGIYDFSSSYRGVIASLYPIYLVFGNNPTAFYAFGLLFYFLAALSVYFFVRV